MSEIKGGINMLRYDQTGPMGQGAGSGRRMGPCFTSDSANPVYRNIRSCGKGRGQGFFMGLMQPGTGDNWLISRKAVLEKELEYINNAINAKNNK